MSVAIRFQNKKETHGPTKSTMKLLKGFTMFSGNSVLLIGGLRAIYGGE